MGKAKMDNSEKPTTQGTKDEEKQNKNTTQHVLDTTIHKQKQITQIIHEPSHKDERNIVSMRKSQLTSQLQTYLIMVILLIHILLSTCMITLC